jgi:hypothetical protein
LNGKQGIFGYESALLVSLGMKLKFVDKGMTSSLLCDKIFMVSKEVNWNLGGCKYA